MRMPMSDDVKAGLVALGALILALGALLVIFGRPEAEHAEAARATEPSLFTELFGGGGAGGSRATPDDAGVGYAALPFDPVFGASFDPTEEDPQVVAMRRSFGPDAGMAGFTPYRHSGHAVLASGLPGVGPSASCDVRVLPVRSEGGFNCVVRVRCDDVIVYPDGALEAGYAPCDVTGGVPRTATDRAPSDRDGDPELFVDLDTRLVRVRDLHGTHESMIEIQLD